MRRGRTASSTLSRHRPAASSGGATSGPPSRPRSSRTAPSTSLTRTDTWPRTPRAADACAGATPPARRSRPHPHSPTDGSTSATTPGRCSRSPPAAAGSSGAAAATATSTPPLRSTPDASTSARSTAASTRSRPGAEPFSGASERGAMSTPRRLCGMASSSSARTTTPSTHSPAAPARSAGRITPALRSPAPPPWSTASSTSRASTTARTGSSAQAVGSVRSGRTASTRLRWPVTAALPRRPRPDLRARPPQAGTVTRSARGSSNVNVAPLPGSESTQILPCIERTSSRLM